MTTSEPDEVTQPVGSVPPSDTEALLGRSINGRYEILERLGKGGMATAYLAHDREVGQKVVIKVPRADLEQEILDRFQREIAAQAELQHPHIVRIRGRGRLELAGRELPFVVADFKEGGHLGERLRSGAQALDEVRDWLLPIAKALDFSHSRGWVHRDVKPDNILFDAHGFVYLSDFGIAKLIDSTLDTLSTRAVGDSRYAAPTERGYVFGTPGYMPPEAMHGDHTAAYDQYSLAIVAMQAISGDLPQKDSTRVSTQALLARLPRSTSRTIARALSDQPEQRFPSCVAFAEALAQEKSPGGPRRFLPQLGAAGLGAVALASFGLWWLRGEPATIEEPISEEASASARAGSAPRSFELGSTPAEKIAALELCEANSDSRCDPEWYADERLHTVELEPFALDAREVTLAEYRAFVADTAHRTLAEQRGASYMIVGSRVLEMPGLSWREPGWDDPDEREPVVHVGRADAIAYCKWQEKRLPSADEWESFARGAARRSFPWGNAWDPDRARWRGSESVRRPAPVGQFPAAPAGTYDLVGNVWEWTASDDEKGLAILKGGSWAETNPANLRSATRYTAAADYSAEDVGFRCAHSLEEWPDATGALASADEGARR